MLALIQNSPRTILQVFDVLPVELDTPEGRVFAMPPSWTSQSGAFSLVPVIPFTVPNGQQTTGSPSYSFDVGNNVVQTYSTIAIPPPTATAQAAALIAGGVTLTSIGTPALNGTYAIDNGTRANLLAISLYVSVNGVLPNGAATQKWPDMAGTVHLFTVITFKAFAKAVTDFVTAVNVALATINSGGSASFPSPNLTIA